MWLVHSFFEALLLLVRKLSGSSRTHPPHYLQVVYQVCGEVGLEVALAAPERAPAVRPLGVVEGGLVAREPLFAPLALGPDLFHAPAAQGWASSIPN